MVSEKSKEPIPLCRFPFPVEVIGDFVVRENERFTYMVRGKNLQPSKKNDRILDMWHRVVSAAVPDPHIGFTAEAYCDKWEDWYLINPKYIRVSQPKAAQVMKMCHYLDIYLPGAVELLANKWQQIL